MWGSAVLSAVVAAVGAPAAPLAVHQEPLIRHLLVAGERVEIGYAVDTPGVTSPTGSLFVRNDLQTGFVRLPMKLGSITHSPARSMTPARCATRAAARPSENVGAAMNRGFATTPSAETKPQRRFASETAISPAPADCAWV